MRAGNGRGSGGGAIQKVGKSFEILAVPEKGGVHTAHRWAEDDKNIGEKVNEKSKI